MNKPEGVPARAWCYPPHIDEDWRLIDTAPNNWMGTIEDHTGEQIADLTDWAVVDFMAAFKFAQETVRRYNSERFGVVLKDYN